MKRCSALFLSALLSVQAAHAADVTLEIAPPQPAWLVPVMGRPCLVGPGQRIEACPVQLQPEGMPLVGEGGLIFDVTALLAAGNYEAVIARARVNYGSELLLLENGDLEGFLTTRTPTDGMQQLGGGAPPIRFSTARAGASGPAITEGTLSTESPRPVDQPGGFGVTTPVNVEADLISASVLFLLGQTYLALERYVPAETAFRLALRGVPNHVRAHESLGMLYLRTERYEQAREHLVRAVELGRNNSSVYAALGYLEQKSRRYLAAASAFQRALVLEPAQRTAQRGLLHALSETHEHAKARALTDQLLRAEPDDAALWLYRAQIALATNQRDVAVASLETALRLGDDSSDNVRACLLLQMESGNVARAVELMRASSARGLPFAVVDRALGWLEGTNEWDYFRELAASVDTATLSGADRSRLLTRRASLALHDGSRRAASTALQEALAIDPANADALLMLGQSYRAERDYARAEFMLQRASAYAAVRDSALVARAELAIEQQNFDDALGHLQDALNSNPARVDLARNIDLLEELALLRTQR